MSCFQRYPSEDVAWPAGVARPESVPSSDAAAVCLLPHETNQIPIIIDCFPFGQNAKLRWHSASDRMHKIVIDSSSHPYPGKKKCIFIIR